jgi:hypothetical protein
MSLRFNMEIGKLLHGSRRWVWRCTCGKPECESLFHGPFKTKRECVADAEETFLTIEAFFESADAVKH